MQVLSIDWDYFQNVSVETVRQCYPDGVDHATALSEVIWGSKYGTYPQINQITVLEKEYCIIQQILLNQNSSCPVMIANSHKHIYEFITKHCDNLNLVNVDMHHDITNGNKTLDCGNWIGTLFKEHKLKTQDFQWVYNPISIAMYGIDEGNTKTDVKLRSLIHEVGLTSLSKIKDQKFDMIFLARSDTWSPPHLDKYFCSLVKLMCMHFQKVIAEQGIENPRQQYLQIASLFLDNGVQTNTHNT